MSFIDLTDVPPRTPLPGTTVHFVHTDTMTLAYWTFEPGVVLPSHAHPHDQLASIIEGEFEMTLGSETKVIRPGMVVHFPPNVPHSGRAITACRFIDVFHPVREDYR